MLPCLNGLGWFDGVGDSHIFLAPYYKQGILNILFLSIPF